MSFPRSAPVLMAALAFVPASAFAQMGMSGMDMSMLAKPAAPSWHVMTHASLTLAADDQEGPRGGSKTFLEGMAMVMASRQFGHGNQLELNAMLSPDAFMGRSGYPLLLQTGETADGVHPLIDRQHPHDLLMGLTARLTHAFDGGSAFIEAGYPGEFAFGPAAFMHRASGEDFPTAPISHHWLDSGHITMGEITAGATRGPLAFEVSQFTGREPDENRFDLDPARLDSTAARLSWQVTPELSLQGSWARQVSPEALEPDVNRDKRSLSMAYGHRFAMGQLDSTLAWGRKRIEHGNDKPSDAWLFENAWHFNGPWIGLARFERVYNGELASQAAWVTKTEIGAIRTFAISKTVRLGLGAVRQFNDVPAPLKAAYGPHRDGTVVFVNLRFSSMAM